MTAWTAEDIRVASVLEAQLGPIRVIEVIEHKENRMTDVVDSAADTAGDWDGETDGPGPFRGATYPEYPYSLADHVYTWSPKLPDGSMLVIRASTAEALAEAAEAVAPLAGRLRAAWQIAVGQPQAAAPIPPAGQYQAGAGAGANFNPQTPAPNQPYAGQPAWQQAGAPQAQAAPQWGGGQQAPQGGQGNKPQPKAQPPGWYRTDKNSGPGADFWKNWREQNQGSLKGKISWGGGSTFWVAPDVAGMVNSVGFIVVAA